MSPEETLEKQKEATQRRALLDSFAFKAFKEGLKIGRRERVHGSILLPEELRDEGYFLEFMEPEEKEGEE